MLSGKVAVVTGAGNGIGSEIAKLMAKHGAKVVSTTPGVPHRARVGTRRSRGLSSSRFTSAGGQAIASVRNVSGLGRCERIIKDAIDAFCRVDVVVNNAGILRDGLFHKMTVKISIPWST